MRKHVWPIFVQKNKQKMDYTWGIVSMNGLAYAICFGQILPQGIITIVGGR